MFMLGKQLKFPVVEPTPAPKEVLPYAEKENLEDQPAYLQDALKLTQKGFEDSKKRKN